MEVNELSGACIVPARIAADMGHQHLQPLAFENAVERVDEAETEVVAVACHTFQRTIADVFLYLCKLKAADYLRHKTDRH